LINLAQAACGGSGIFLNHIKKLKSHRGRLLESFAGLGLPPAPRQAVGHAFLAQLAQNLLETPEQIIEVSGDFIETQ
jgi:hypothetical protein